MGGKKTKTSVASTTQNLAGDYKDRIKYKSIVLMGGIMDGSVSMTESIIGGYSASPYHRLRSFYNYTVKNNLKQVLGLTRATMRTFRSLDTYKLTDVFSRYLDTNDHITVAYANVMGADVTYFALQWLLNNRPELFEDLDLDQEAFLSGWEVKPANPEEDTNQFIITITPTGENIPITLPTEVDPLSTYLVIAYNSSTKESVVSDTTTTTEIEDPEEFPDRTDEDDSWLHEGTSNTQQYVDLGTTIITEKIYSGGADPEEETEELPDLQPFTKYSSEYSLQFSDYSGATTKAHEITETHEEFVDVVLYENITTNTYTDSDPDKDQVTETITTITREAVPYKRVIAREVITALSNPNPLKVFIYEKGTGSLELDKFINEQAFSNSVFGSYQDKGKELGFYPHMTIRNEKKWISNSYYSNHYKLYSKAYRRLVGKPLDSLIKSINKESGISDVNHIYYALGVNGNAKDDSNRLYIYKFVKNIVIDLMSAGRLTAEAPESANTSYKNYLDQVNAAKNGTINSGGSNYGKPTLPKFMGPNSGNYTLNMRNPGMSDFDITIEFNNINYHEESGMKSPKGRTKHAWIVNKTFIRYDSVETEEGSGEYRRIVSKLVATFTDGIVIYYQRDANTVEVISIGEGTHFQHIKNGKGAESGIRSSSFLYPLHEGILRELSPIHRAQVGMECMNMVSSSYSVQRVSRWKSLLKSVLPVIAIVVAIATSGAGLGLLGANAAVGAAMGFAAGSTAAIIAGGIANALAAIVVSKVIQMGVTKLLGNTMLGSIISALVSVIVVNMGTAMRGAGMTFSNALTSLMDMKFVLNLSLSGLGGYNDGIALTTQQKMEEQAKAINEYAKQAEEIQKRFQSEFGGMSLLSPDMFMSANMDLYNEKPDEFLDRTLMTLNDNIDLTLNALYDFPELSLQLEV